MNKTEEPETNKKLLVCNNVSLKYSQGKNESVQVLKSINLNVAKGEWLSIVGPSGSGKSSLLYCLSGLVKPNSGDVIFENKKLNKLSRTALANLRRKEISFIFQAYNTIPSLTVKENVQLSANLANKRSNWKQSLEIVGLQNKARRFPDQLSGGEQQRVSIARAIATGAKIIFADEPTGALDSRTGANILNYLEQTVKQGQTVIMVTHDLAAAARTNRSIILKDGEIMAEITNPSEESLFNTIRGLNKETAPL